MSSTESTSDLRPEANGTMASDKIAVMVAPFTGGPFSVQVSKKDSVEDFKKIVAKRLKVLKDRICLLYRDSQLSEGSLEDNCVVDGSRITLLPRTETGLLAQRPEQSVMQALESLSDSQVVDFLSGKAPLNLTMRLGDHMMLIQLQLSTVNSATASAAKRSRTSMAGSSVSRQPNVSSTTQAAAAAAAAQPACAPTAEPAPAAAPAAAEAAEDVAGESYKPKLNHRALNEASKNLTKTLKQLSSEVLTNKCGEAQQSAKASSSASAATSASAAAGTSAAGSAAKPAAASGGQSASTD